jgi:farnesyl diphosphate synthase
MQNFEDFLHRHLPKATSFHPTYEDALGRMLLAGGKRFRPALLLGVVKAFNPLLLDAAYYAALSLEVMHTYSLIHDDLPAMDNAALRRGEPTLHVTYDEVTAILAGDALNTYAFELLSAAPLADSVKIRLVHELAVNGGHSGMVLGQACDCYFENKKLNLEQIKSLHTNKTAKLIAASLKMGAIIVNEAELEEILYDFGIKLGLLFQIQDDILDATQTDEEAGKTTQNDTDKNSFVTLLGLQQAKDEANSLAEELTKQLGGFEHTLYTTLSPLLTHYINRHKG